MGFRYAGEGAPGRSRGRRLEIKSLFGVPKIAKGISWLQEVSHVYQENSLR